MATIPIQTTPTVGLEAGGFTPATPGPAVQPIKDVTGEQIYRMGAASEKLGGTLMQVADRLQGEFNDAEKKELDNRYAEFVGQQELQFGQLYGKDAATQSTQYLENLAKQMDQLAQSASNPAVAQMFKDSAVVRMRAANLNIQRRAVDQQREFDLGESAAQVNNFVTDASRNWEAVNVPGGNFAMFRGAAIRSAEDLADKKGWGEKSAQREKLILDTKSAITSQVVQNMANANRYVEAQEYLDKSFESKDVDARTYQSLQNMVGTGFRREQGVDAANRIYEGAGKGAATDFNDAVSWVLSKEGGYVPDDAGAGPTKYGINSKANPGVDVANLTQDQAKEIYKTKYWDAIKADDLPPALRAAAFDAAVNQGVPTAKRMLREADGDFDKFISLRRAEYARLIKADPEKYGQYKDGWDNRLNDLVAANLQQQGQGTTKVPGQGREGQPNLQEMLKQADLIADPQERDFAKSTIKERYNTEVSLAEENYRITKQQVQDIAFAQIGGWKNVPPDLWAKLKPEDQRIMVEGVPRGDDPDTVLKLMNDPQLIKPGSIENYRHLLSESTYRTLAAKGSDPAKILEATIDTEQFNAALLNNEMQDLINPRSGSEEQAQVIRLRELFEQQIDAEQIIRGRKLTRDERGNILNGIFKDTAYAVGMISDTQKPLFALSKEEMEDAYVRVMTFKNGDATEEEIKISSIPAVERRNIVNALRKANQAITEQRIAELWVAAGRPGTSGKIK